LPLQQLFALEHGMPDEFDGTDAVSTDAMAALA
jgi:hypothetical protein